MYLHTKWTENVWWTKKYFSDTHDKSLSIDAVCSFKCMQLYLLVYVDINILAMVDLRKLKGLFSHFDGCLKCIQFVKWNDWIMQHVRFKLQRCLYFWSYFLKFKFKFIAILHINLSKKNSNCVIRGAQAHRFVFIEKPHRMRQMQFYCSSGYVVESRSHNIIKHFLHVQLQQAHVLSNLFVRLQNVGRNFK